MRAHIPNPKPEPVAPQELYQAVGDMLSVAPEELPEGPQLPEKLDETQN